jgi:two-component system, LytTR family, sensor kinase
MGASLPALLLQPVVENAIKFGLYGTTGEVEIAIDAVKEGGAVRINIRNPYDAVSARSTKGTGFGLSAIARRLSLLYGRADLMSAGPEGALFVTSLLIPQA